MPAVILKGYVIVPSEDIDAVMAELPKHIENTRKEQGCLTFNVEPDRANLCQLNVYEEFVDEAAFSFHQERVKASQWGKVSANVERHYHVDRR